MTDSNNSVFRCSKLTLYIAHCHAHSTEHNTSISKQDTYLIYPPVAETVQHGSNRQKKNRQKEILLFNFMYKLI